MQFSIIKTAVEKKFKVMSGMDLFMSDVDKDEMYKTYLEAFPDGDKMFRNRTEHDCSACKNFIRAIGNIVAINEKHELISIWDIEDISDKEPAYQIVANKLAELVKSKAITNCFLTDQKKIGVDKSFETIIDKITTWQHFHIEVPKRFIKNMHDIGPELSEMKARYGVLLRGLNELPIDAINTVLELINDGAIYRGAEFEHLVTAFKNIKVEFAKIQERNKDNFVWSELSTIPPEVAKFRNTSIGTLVINISEGMDIDIAVRKFEEMMYNYKRTSSVVTKRMIDDARIKLESLGLVSALPRRYATLEDVDIKHTLFVNREIKHRVHIDVFDELKELIPDTKRKSDKIETIHIDKFISDILPNVKSIDLLVENKHSNRFVSLTTAENPTARLLFKWNNPFSWTYAGDNADSIRERVKLAGGSVDGEFNNRLAWFNTDDLDIHMCEPGGYEIYYGNRSRKSPSLGQLDVDMNAGGTNLIKNAVENITYKYIRDMKSGEYGLVIHNFNRRETIDVGFDAEIDVLGKIYNFVYRKPIKSKESVHVATFKKHAGKDGQLELVESFIENSQSTRTVWNIPTEKFHPVKAILLSPNYWEDNGVGNMHYMFMLNNCINDGSARGFYNEFLHNDLTPYRNAMDMIGSKMRTDENDINQLSGLGFSSTVRNEVVVKVSGTFTRKLKILF